MAGVRGIDLAGRNLEYMSAPGAFLAKADLRGARLRCSVLAGADLRGADLYEADIEGADLRFAKGLTVEQVKLARNWEMARYSPDFRSKLGLPPPKDD